MPPLPIQYNIIISLQKKILKLQLTTNGVGQILEKRYTGIPLLSRTAAVRDANL
jgi:hypothetical protein